MDEAKAQPVEPWLPLHSSIGEHGLLFVSGELVLQDEQAAQDMGIHRGQGRDLLVPSKMRIHLGLHLPENVLHRHPALGSGTQR